MRDLRTIRVPESIWQACVQRSKELFEADPSLTEFHSESLDTEIACRQQRYPVWVGVASFVGAVRGVAAGEGRERPKPVGRMQIPLSELAVQFLTEKKLEGQAKSLTVSQAVEHCMKQPHLVAEVGRVHGVMVSGVLLDLQKIRWAEQYAEHLDIPASRIVGKSVHLFAMSSVKESHGQPA